MQFIRLENTDSQEFKEAWKIYRSSFPPDERRTLRLQKEVMKDKRYNFFVVIENKTLVAIICIWNLKVLLYRNFASLYFVEHFAVKREFRGKGIGTRLLKKYLSKVKQMVVLETERPRTEIAAKRIRFYERNGFKLNTFDYIQPPYGKGKKPVPLFLMTHPKKINAAEFSSIREKLYTVIYHVKNHVKKVKSHLTIKI